ncbi:MAG TPA: metallophosphoesterase [Candidatus Thioglobus sp.]|jgi:putative phosphoesterase|nr:metallophosphoesterase [Candidatus Thioglobus sp.]HIB30701.1 metallophosphoesterase [Candidatus Thioglobus sp.]HIB97113.1 metallophosphoesterase [Candidatus Thioglobus sp.]
MNFLIKIGILSDTHGFIHTQIIKLMTQCDFVIHAGDIVDAETLLLLKPKQQLIAIQGNNDSHLTQLKTVEKIDLPGGLIVVEHGHLHGRKQPSHDSLRDAYPEAKMIIYGHTHKQIIEQDSTPWIVNPGAAGVERNHGGSKCLIVEITDSQEWNISAHSFN